MPQATLFDFPEPSARGNCYLMTDGLLLKWGWTGRPTPKPRSGELRARVVGYKPGTRADERTNLSMVRRWAASGEWFKVPDAGPQLAWLLTTVGTLQPWHGVPAVEALADVIAANLQVLRRAA